MPHFLVKSIKRFLQAFFQLTVHVACQLKTQLCAGVFLRVRSTVLKMKNILRKGSVICLLPIWMPQMLRYVLGISKNAFLKNVVFLTVKYVGFSLGLQFGYLLPCYMCSYEDVQFCHDF